MAFVIDRYRKYFTEKKWRQGQEYFNEGKVRIINVSSCYIDDSDEAVVVATAEIEGSEDRKYRTRIVLDRNQLVEMYCSCPNYKGSYKYWTYTEGCKHIVATVFAVIDYSKKYHIDNNSSKSVVKLIENYENDHITNSYISVFREKCDILPKLELGGGYPKVSFRIGNSKKYVIKNLFTFAENMTIGEVQSYGQNLEFLHHMNSLTEKGQAYGRFIISRINENKIVSEGLGNYWRTYEKRSLILSPHYFDVFFSIHGQDRIEIANVRSVNKSSKIVTANLIQGNPELKVFIKRYGEVDEEQEGMAGITIAIEDIEYIEGEEYAYILKEDNLYRSDTEFMKAMNYFLKCILKNDTKDMIVDTKDIGNFYARVVHTIGEYCDIIEEAGLDIEQYLLPEPEFAFYFDINDKNLTCYYKVIYGKEEMDPYFANDTNEEKRDLVKESEVSNIIHQYLPYYDEETKWFHVGNEDERIYELLEDGVSEIMNYGRVHVSEELKKMMIKKSPKISVGVSVFSDLLNLEFKTEDFDLSELADILASYRLKKKFHRLKNGDFLSIDEGSMATLSELIDSMKISVKEFTKGKMKIPMYRALYLDKLLQESGNVEYERDTYFKTLLRNFKSVEDSEYPVPGYLKNILRNYQKTGYRWLRTIEDYGFGGILADDMGLGKTIQVISLITGTYKEEDKATSIVICPASLVFNWTNEFNMYGQSLKVLAITGTAEERQELIGTYGNYDVLVTSYVLLKRDIEHYEDIVFKYQIIDEAQNIKNYTTQSAKAVKLIHAKTKFALTGTPIENRLSELWSIFDYLMPGFLYKYDKFKKSFELPIVKYKDEMAIKRLRQMISPFVLRRLKKDVLKDLPDKIEQTTYAKFQGEQLDLYNAYVAKIKEGIQSQSKEDFEKNKFRMLAELTRIRQICCDPKLCFSDYTGESTKLDTCMELIQNAINGGHKLLVFSQFTSMLDLISEKLREDNISYYEITGSTPKEKRVKLVSRFNDDDTSVFLISLKAGGTGLNLTGADIVIHYDPWWNVAAQNQATDRTHRIGQSKVVTVFKIIVKDTIEEKILKMQESKLQLADEIISGEMNNITTMTKEDFLDFL